MKTSPHTLCECEDLATLRHVYLGYFFLNAEDTGGADKSLARPGKKEATATEHFDVHISYL